MTTMMPGRVLPNRVDVFFVFKGNVLAWYRSSIFVSYVLRAMICVFRYYFFLTKYEPNDRQRLS